RQENERFRAIKRVFASDNDYGLNHFFNLWVNNLGVYAANAPGRGRKVLQTAICVACRWTGATALHTIGTYVVRVYVKASPCNSGEVGSCL
ncbi:hypothetical protein, partial [Klebsiella aerogenes]|uniref:hypothetical protein n=1 Tax=Klebsiella aerogenes TaxID=548 RepID=UPI001967E484